MLAAALRLVDADGVEVLSMRRLGKALDRDSMQLYRYAPSKDAVLDGVVELVPFRLEVREFPRIRALASELATYDGAQELDEGLTVVLAGLRTWVRLGARRSG